MDSGALVPDEIVSRILIARLGQPDCAAGFVLDGFPWTVPQAVAFHRAGFCLDHVIELLLEDAEVFRRLGAPGPQTLRPDVSYDLLSPEGR